MSTKFKYQNKDYEVDIDPKEWYEKDKTLLVKLSNGGILTVDHWNKDDTIPYLTSIVLLEATEINLEELTFQSLLKEYNLTDNNKTRKLWYKCYKQRHSGGLQEISNWFHELVDLIKED